MFKIFRKELADHFSSTRFLILFCLIMMVALVTTYMSGASIKEALSGGQKQSFIFLMIFSKGQYISLTQFIAVFGPMIGLIMGFDAVNRERNAGTLAKLLSQPIFRDAVINGKFLAGVVTIAIMLTGMLLMISGLGLATLGEVPGAEEIGRLIVYLVFSIAYVSFWLGLAILFSILFRSVATSALASVALWIFMFLFVSFGANSLAKVVSPVDNPKDPEQVVRQAQVARMASMVSPVVLYTEATSTIMDPSRRTTQNFMLVGTLENISMSRFENPLSLEQSMLVVVPYLTSILALMFICFGVSYVVFMRQEIRSA